MMAPIHRFPTWFLGCGILIALVRVAGAEVTVAEEGLGVAVARRDWPAVSLRGYGRVFGKSWSGAQGSMLEIGCEDSGKAKLTLAKYLSDLQAIPGAVQAVKLPELPVPVWRMKDQGLAVALRSGSRVLILAAPDSRSLVGLVGHGLAGDLAAASHAAEVDVPMWLDRWDKHGFRFYYRPWEKPEAGASVAYDPGKEFDFAEECGRSGLVFWANAEQVDTAEGMTNSAWWDYAAKAAAERKLPAGLNLMLGGPGMSWFFNRYRQDDISKMPQYCGTYHSIADSHHGGSGFTSWNSRAAQDANLGLLQSIIRREAERGNLTTILEPHGELKHGDYDILVEHGPVADAAFRAYLQDRYQDLAALNRAWGAQCGTWEDVRVPEVASFLGWGPQALDLSGTWRIAQEPGEGDSANPGTTQAPGEWFEPGFDDRSWPSVVAPGHDRAMFWPKRPAVCRRSLNLPEQWLKREKVWLYLWDLNTDWNQPVQIYLNGEKAAEDVCRHPVCHFMAAEVTGHLKAGENQIALRVPSGYLGYRVYLSPDAPVQYPKLGVEKNARWVDFSGWIGWSRVQAAKRGIEMIRQAQPGIQIDLMAPDGYADGIKGLAVSYGGNFKNTGYMGAFWADFLPAQMRGAGLPFSLEPGGPAKDLPGFKKLMGLYHTEGVQAVDYFIHIGNVMWNPEIRDHFEKTIRMTRLIGKCHPPKADVAFLWATGTKSLTGYPWGSDPNTNLPGGWNCKGVGDALLWRGWPRDGVSECDFANGNAGKYRVIIDTNTSILSRELERGVEDYVRGGGTFVTFVQTGRHTPTQPDTWPISRLTGYDVLSWDKPERAGGEPGSPSQTLKPAAGQDVYPTPEPWMERGMTGLRLRRAASDAQDLLYWKDGAVAAGVRPLGKGRIVHLGCRDGGAVWMGLAPEAFEALLKWSRVARVPAHLEGEENGKRLLMRHSVSNNGFFDVWSLWNQSPTDAVEASLVFDDRTLARGIEVETGEPVDFEPGRLSGLQFEPLQTRIILTARRDAGEAPLAWFELQRNWWRGTNPAPDKPLPPPPHRNSVDLSEDWSFRPLADGEYGAAFVAAGIDDQKWERVPLGVWTFPGKKAVQHALLRKSFTVPCDWGGGAVELWLQSWHLGTFVNQGRVWLDGRLVRDWKADGLPGINPDGVLRPGTRHLLALEIRGDGALAGTRGSCWLWVWPQAQAQIDLGGEWEPSGDALHYAAPIRLPGSCEVLTLRRHVTIPGEQQLGKAVMLDVTADGPVLGVLINGRWLRRLHHLIGTRFQLNLTPWVRFGQDNEIEIVLRNKAKTEIKAVALRCYAPDQQYP